MAKITSVIDIGSNSVRMAIFETSRFAFHLIYETKSKARISDAATKLDVFGQAPMQLCCIRA